MAAVKKLGRYVDFCTGQSYEAFPPTYESVSDFLLILIRERNGSTQSIDNDKSHLKTQCLLGELGCLSYTESIKLRQLIAMAKGEDFSESNVKDALRFATLCQIIAKFDLSDLVQLLKATILAFGHDLLLRTAESASGIKAQQLTWRISQKRLGISLLLLRTKTYRTGSGCLIDIDAYQHPFAAVNL